MKERRRAFRMRERAAILSISSSVFAWRSIVSMLWKSGFGPRAKKSSARSAWCTPLRSNSPTILAISFWPFAFSICSLKTWSLGSRILMKDTLVRRCLFVSLNCCTSFCTVHPSLRALGSVMKSSCSVAVRWSSVIISSYCSGVGKISYFCLFRLFVANYQSILPFFALLLKHGVRGWRGKDGGLDSLWCISHLLEEFSSVGNGFTEGKYLIG